MQLLCFQVCKVRFISTSPVSMKKTFSGKLYTIYLDNEIASDGIFSYFVSLYFLAALERVGN